MQHIGKAFLVGLGTVLPVALTIYLFYILGAGAERLMGGALKAVLPESLYFPGLGLLLAVIAITLIGFLVRLPGLHLLVRLNDAVMTRIPVVKTIYTTIRDVINLFSATRDGTQVGRPVKVRLMDEVEVIGLVTIPDLDEERALVFVPMSFQLGGYSLHLNKDRIRPLDMTVEDALRFAVTAGIQRPQSTNRNVIEDRRE